MNSTDQMRKLMDSITINEVKEIDASSWNENDFEKLESLFDNSVELPELLDLSIVPENELEPDEDEDSISSSDILDWLSKYGHTIARISDNYGWDDIYMVPSGHIVWPDRNSGQVSIADPGKKNEIMQAIATL